MSTYRDYATDSGLGFGIDETKEGSRIYRASDCGGSELFFRFRGLTVIGEIREVDAIGREIASDDECTPEGTPDDDGAGLCKFWRHVEAVIRTHTAEVWDTEAAAKKSKE